MVELEKEAFGRALYAALPESVRACHPENEFMGHFFDVAAQLVLTGDLATFWGQSTNERFYDRSAAARRTQAAASLSALAGVYRSASMTGNPDERT